MPTPIDPTRLPRLKAALKKFGDDDMLPQQELAKIYGVTNARFTTLAHNRFEDMPPAERRGDKTHWFNAKRSILAMIAYLQGAGEKKRAAAKRAAAVMGDVAAETPAAAPAESAPDLMTPAEIDKLASAQTRMFRLAQEKGQFVRADMARRVIRTIFTTVQRSVTALPNEVDPNGELPPLHRARLEAAVRASMGRIFETVKDNLVEDEAEARAA
jgi:hypothetical protein